MTFVYAQNLDDMKDKQAKKELEERTRLYWEKLKKLRDKVDEISQPMIEEMRDVSNSEVQVVNNAWVIKEEDHVIPSFDLRIS